jgi:hypothetical protein
MTANRLFPDKIDRLAIIQEAHKQTQAAIGVGLKPYLVIDGAFFAKLGLRVDIPGLQILEGDQALAALDAVDPAASVVLYAVEHALDGLAVARRLVERKIRFLPLGAGPVGGWVYDDPVARQVIEDAYIGQTLAGFAKFEDPGSKDDFVNLTQALHTTDRIEGCVVEVGCFRGSSGAVMLDYANAKQLRPKAFHFFDVFDGFNYKEALESSDAVWAKTHRTEGEAAVRERLTAKAGIHQVTVRKMNVISDVLPADVGPVALLNLDVDLYEAVAAGLKRFAPLIVRGGILICEDAGHTPGLIGARLALQEFLESKRGAAFTPVHMPSGQAFLIKHADL